MADELPEITPFNAVYQSEKYYDIEPQRATEIIKKVGGGIADIMLPQDATDVMMMAVPPVMVYNKVKKILDRANKLRAEAQSFFKSARESGSRIERETANFKNNEAARIVKAVPEDEIKIYNDYEKTLTPSKEESNKALAEIRKNLGIDPKKKQFEELANKGKIRQARTNKENISAIKNKETPAQDFNIQNMSDDIEFDYEAGDFTKHFEDAGLHVIDDRMGSVIVGRTKKDAINLLNAKNPIDYGKAYGYSDADIAQFYITRRGGNVDNAYKDFTKDLLDISK